RTLVSGGAGLALQVVDASDGSVLYALGLPTGRLVTHGRTTKYDRRGPFRGHLALKDMSGQRDTVHISLAANDAPGTGLDRSRALRVRVTTEGGCARTCAATCALQKHRLTCHASDVYVPFADDGFGVLTGRHRPRSANPWCGLAVDT